MIACADAENGLFARSAIGLDLFYKPWSLIPAR